MPYKYEQFADRLERAKFWLEQCAPDQVNRLRETRNFEVYNTLSDEEKLEISKLHDYLAAGGYSLGWGKGDGNVLKNHYKLSHKSFVPHIISLTSCGIIHWSHIFL